MRSIVGATVPWVRENLQEWADLDAAQAPLLASAWAAGGGWLRLGVAASIRVPAPMASGVWWLLRPEVK